MTAPEPAPAEKQPSNLEHIIGWAIVLLLFAGCLLVLRPFVSSLLWALIFCSASWPFYLKLLRLLRNHNALAASLMTILMVLLLLMPFVIIGSSLADSVKDLTEAARKWIEAGPPQPPEWLGKIPLVGERAIQSWQNIATDTSSMMTQIQKWLPTVSTWLLKGGLVLGHGLLQLAFSIFIAFFLFRDGIHLSGWVNTAVERIAGDKGLRLLTVGRNTVRGVVYGILGTALLQAVLMGIGFAVAEVPGAVLLSLLTFFASVVPGLGTSLVSVPAGIWLFHQNQIGWGIFIIVWGLAVGSLENFVRPWLISQGSAMPFLLIFFGILGGIVVFGFIGVFLGPTLLAVGYRITQEWIPASLPAPPEIKTDAKPAGGT